TVHLHNSSPFSLFFARKANGFSNYTNEEDNTMSQEELLKRLEYMTTVVFPTVRERSKITQARMIKRFNATVLHNEFPDGTMVMTLDPIKGNKLSPRYEGPYMVIKRTSHGSYILKDGTGEVLKRHYAPSQLKLVLDDFEDTSTYEVERIVNHRPSRVTPNTVEYSVKWKNYPSSKNTWEPEEHFIERQCIADYWAEHHAKQINTSHNSAATSPKEDKRKAERDAVRPTKKRNISRDN
ncbi:hypothetical protein BGZ80_007460, partial [Entomortierella chlamydospora]